MTMEMETLKLSTDWAEAEALSSKIAGILSFAVFLVALRFWPLGRTPMAKSLVWLTETPEMLLHKQS